MNFYLKKASKKKKNFMLNFENPSPLECQIFLNGPSLAFALNTFVAKFLQQSTNSLRHQETFGFEPSKTSTLKTCLLNNNNNKNNS